MPRGHRGGHGGPSREHRGHRGPGGGFYGGPEMPLGPGLPIHRYYRGGRMGCCLMPLLGAVGIIALLVAIF